MTDDARMIVALKKISDELEPLSTELQARLLASLAICFGCDELVVSKFNFAQSMFRKVSP